MKDHRRSSRDPSAGVPAPAENGTAVGFPTYVAVFLKAHPTGSPDEMWDSFLKEFGDLLLRTARYTNRGHDASMDAYAFILERLKQDDFRRLRGFSGGDREAFSRWLVVVARRLCSDLMRRRYGRNRPSTPEVQREARRRLADEVWEPQEPSELPTGKESNPEWKLRREERRNALDSAMEKMEPRDRLLLTFRFEDGLSGRRISELMDFPSAFHVYRRLKHVLAALRERLESMGINDPDP